MNRLEQNIISPGMEGLMWELGDAAANSGVLAWCQELGWALVNILCFIILIYRPVFSISLNILLHLIFPVIIANIFFLGQLYRIQIFFLRWRKMKAQSWGNRSIHMILTLWLYMLAGSTREIQAVEQRMVLGVGVGWIQQGYARWHWSWALSDSFQIDHRREQGVAGRGRRKIPGLKMQDVVVEREQSTVV